MIFSSGLFAVVINEGMEPIAAWAECEADLMGQPIVRFHCLVGEGFMSMDYEWASDFLFLRTDFTRSVVDLVMKMEETAPYEIDQSFPYGEDERDAFWDVDDPEQLLSTLVSVVSSGFKVMPFTPEHFTSLSELPMGSGLTLAEEFAERGSWQPRVATNS